VPPSAPEPGGDARRAALEIVGTILDRGRTLDQALDGNRSLAVLAPRDRAFARLLVTTVLRRLGEIDGLIDRCLAKPPPARVAGAIRAILRVGIAQLVFVGTPAHAAVDRSVALAAGRLAPYRGLINAVLRRIGREGAAALGDGDPAVTNTPGWLMESWRRAYGEETARLIAARHLEEPPLDLTARGDARAWAERLGGTLLPTGSIRIPHAGRVDALDGYAEGAWWVQDAAAALPARLLGDVAGRRVLDMAAAPGGKTAQLAASGASVTALDGSAARQDLTRANLARLGLDAEIVVADARAWRPESRFDAVLLDVPCSATGTIRRHPDIARIKRPGDPAALALIQDALLDAAIALLAPGGRLVYACCSLQPEEGPERIAALLARAPGLTREPVEAAEVGGMAELIDAAGDLRTLPCHLAEAGGMDGFYAARLRLSS
jgi:16S rRNA (cytosine967-C5)-methyltransferase